jgi:hypothetical protein
MVPSPPSRHTDAEQMIAEDYDSRQIADNRRQSAG